MAGPGPGRMLWLSLPLIAACMLATRSSAQLPRTRDSAGIHIVENAARAKAPIAFRLSDKPTFDFGGLKENPDDELNKNDAYLRDIRLSDGRHVIDDQDRLRFLDASGKQQRVVGRKGQGPGEFQFVAELCATHGDSVVVADPANARVTVFDKSGALVKEIPVGRNDMPVNGCFNDGTWIVREAVRYPSVSLSPAAGEARITRLVRRRLDGTIVDTLGEFWGGDLGLFVSTNPTFEANGARLFVGDPRASEVRVYDLHHKLVQIVRTADPLQKTTASEQDAMEPTLSVATTDQAIRDRFKERLRTTPRPKVWPSYQQIAVDPDGRLWVQDFQKDRKATEFWTAFDPAGKMLGKLSIPPRTNPGDPRIIAFTSGGVLILHDDSDGAHHLSTYALVPVKGAAH